VITSPATATPSTANTGTAIAFVVAASDPNGDALTYSWTFGDGESASGASVSRAYATAGTFTATATVSDGHGGSASSSTTASIQSVVVKSVHVAAIAMKLSTSHKGNAGVATITIQDANGVAVGGATVSGTWSGLTSANVSANTSSAGTVSFTSARTRNTGSFTFTVTNVSASGYTYAASQNAATSGTISSSGQVTISAAPAFALASAQTLPAVDDAINISAVQGQAFKLALQLPAALSGVANVRASASGVPAGVRVSGASIGGRPKDAGTYLATVTFQAKLSGGTTAKATQRYMLNVTGN
jgi:hypothetical protein